VTLSGTVEKVIKSPNPKERKAQITVEGADELYREIRIDNTLQDENGAPADGTTVKENISDKK
jgi:hypothetical protein